jgi:hypothetical protein
LIYWHILLLPTEMPHWGDLSTKFQWSASKPMVGTTRGHHGLGSMLWFWKYFRLKNMIKIWLFWLKMKLFLQKRITIAVFFHKIDNFIAGNWSQSRKKAIMTFIQGWAKYESQ